METKKEKQEDIQTIVSRIKKKYIDALVDSKCSICGANIKVFQTEIEHLCSMCERTKEAYKNNLQRLEYMLPIGYRDIKFENFKLRDDVKNLSLAFKIAKDFVSDNIGFYLYGGVGLGKTHLLVSALRACVLANKSCKLLRYSSELKNYKEKGIKKEDFFDEYAYCDFLFIDDFGSIGSKDDAIDILYGILQKRIENKKGKKIFITANIAISEIEDDRVKSRIVGMCTGYRCHDNGVDTEQYRNIVELSGSDIRLKGEL